MMRWHWHCHECERAQAEQDRIAYAECRSYGDYLRVARSRGDLAAYLAYGYLLLCAAWKSWRAGK